MYIFFLKNKNKTSLIYLFYNRPRSIDFNLKKEEKLIYKTDFHLKICIKVKQNYLEF